MPVAGMTITASVDRDVQTGTTAVRLDGILSRVTSPQIRSAVIKAVAECPTAVIVDLGGLRSTEPHLLSVFGTVAETAVREWGVPVVVCCATDEMARGIALFRTFVRVYTDRRQAELAAGAHVPRWMHEHIGATPPGVAAARALVGDACRAWDLARLEPTARLIASELASNAIVHARTTFDVTVAHSGVYLRIAVQDGSRQGPQPTSDRPAEPMIRVGGNGLRFVAELSTHWGWVAVPTGKIVWTLLRARPLPQR
jgi:hypothetical protein